MKNSESWRIIDEGGTVRRHHSNPIIKDQTNADHQWRCAAMILWIDPDASMGLIKRALFHDCLEVITGDVPATAKMTHEELNDALERIENSFYGSIPEIHYKTLEWENFLFDIVDKLEFLSFCTKEIQLGSYYSRTKFDLTYDLVKGMIFHFKKSKFKNSVGEDSIKIIADRLEELFNIICDSVEYIMDDDPYKRFK